VLEVSAAGAEVYRGVAPLALRYERSLLEPLSAADRATLDRLLGVLTQRAESNSLEMREAAVSARTRPARRTQTRRSTVR
jgi:hypothetical protein